MPMENGKRKLESIHILLDFFVPTPRVGKHRARPVHSRLFCGGQRQQRSGDT